MPTQTPSILDILTHTPWWAWALLAFVLFLGWQATRDRTVVLWRVLILPAVMTVTAATSIAASGWSVTPAVLVGVAVGGAVGWLLEREGATKRLENGRLWLRGEWLTFAQVLTVFAVRYTTTVIGVVNPMLSASFVYHLAIALILSLLSALFLGRTAARLSTYFRRSAPLGVSSSAS